MFLLMCKVKLKQGGGVVYYSRHTVFSGHSLMGVGVRGGEVFTDPRQMEDVVLLRCGGGHGWVLQHCSLHRPYPVGKGLS